MSDGSAVLLMLATARPSDLSRSPFTNSFMIISTQQTICAVEPAFDAFLSHAQRARRFDDALPSQLPQLYYSSIFPRHALQGGTQFSTQFVTQGLLFRVRSVRNADDRLRDFAGRYCFTRGLDSPHPQLSERLIDNDRGQPRQDARSSFEFPEVANGAQICLLNGVLGVCLISQDSPGDGQQPASMLPNRFD